MSAGDRIRKAQEQTAPTPFRKPSGRASFPRRVTLDLDDERYQFMRRAAYEDHTSIAELLRAAIDLMRADESLREQVGKAAANPPPG